MVGSNILGRTPSADAEYADRNAASNAWLRDWLRVTVEPGNPNVFVFDQRIVAANMVQH